MGLNSVFFHISESDTYLTINSVCSFDSLISSTMVIEGGNCGIKHPNPLNSHELGMIRKIHEIGNFPHKDNLVCKLKANHISKCQNFPSFKKIND